MYEHNALGYWSGLTLCLTKVRSSRARCPATALIIFMFMLSVCYLAEFAFILTISDEKKKNANSKNWSTFFERFPLVVEVVYNHHHSEYVTQLQFHAYT